MDRQYTVEECYALCTNEPDCGAFVITKVNFDTDHLPINNYVVDGQFPKGACFLYGGYKSHAYEGCNGDMGGEKSLFETYEMRGCQNKCKLFDY